MAIVYIFKSEANLVPMLDQSVGHNLLSVLLSYLKLIP